MYITVPIWTGSSWNLCLSTAKPLLHVCGLRVRQARNPKPSSWTEISSCPKAKTKCFLVIGLLARQAKVWDVFRGVEVRLLTHSSFIAREHLFWTYEPKFKGQPSKVNQVTSHHQNQTKQSGIHDLCKNKNNGPQQSILPTPQLRALRLGTCFNARCPFWLIWKLIWGLAFETWTQTPAVPHCFAHGCNYNASDTSKIFYCSKQHWPSTKNWLFYNIVIKMEIKSWWNLDTPWCSNGTMIPNSLLKGWKWMD